MDKEEHYCIRTKHVVIICMTVVVCCLVVGLAVGLTREGQTSTTTTAPIPTTAPTKPPVPDRGPCQASTDSSGGWQNFRLPDFVTPVHYDLHLEPNMDNDTYTGTVDVHVKVSKPTRHLWLHIRETFVNAMPRLRKAQTKLVVKNCFEYKRHQYVVVEVTEELPSTGPEEVYVLSLDFQGWLNGSLVGFYRVVYTEEGKTK